MTTFCFDFDGVLVRSRTRDKQFIWSANIESDLGFPAELKARIFALPDWQQIVTGKRDFHGRLAALFQEFGVDCQVDTFIDYWLERDLNWRPEMLAIAQELKDLGADLHIATNQDRVRTRHIQSLPRVQQLFRLVLTSSDLGHAKPDEAFFRAATDKIDGGRNQTIVLIDDDARNIASATAAGWVGIPFNPDQDPMADFENLRHQLRALISQRPERL